jgi:hypothetical protein
MELCARYLIVYAVFHVCMVLAGLVSPLHLLLDHTSITMTWAGRDTANLAAAHWCHPHWEKVPRHPQGGVIQGGMGKFRPRGAIWIPRRVKQPDVVVILVNHHACHIGRRRDVSTILCECCLFWSGQASHGKVLGISTSMLTCRVSSGAGCCCG